LQRAVPRHLHGEGASRHAAIARPDHRQAAAPARALKEVPRVRADWQRSFWGVNYARLLAIKKKVDPDNLFRVHHDIGSET
jgi:FAD/FMN-containing dehydrogenase